MMIHISRDGQQFGPYTLEDAQAHLASGALLATDQAWYEGAPDWMPLDQVPGVSVQPAFAAAPDPNDPLAAANPAVAAAAAGAASAAAAQGSKKKIMIIAGSVVGVGAIAAVLVLFVFNKDDGADDDSDKGGAVDGEKKAFSQVIKPIFKTHKCYDCHSSVNGTVKADLDFDKPETVGELVKDGELVKRLKDMGEDRMPPEGKGDRLSPSEIQKVEAWVAWGGNF